ncbi:MAG TPA: aminotransferase class V-fold PLP-dependent enzyme [Saprospiraceae bacterium]|nr:aminotransferase class V-fold PLP-dependent enzyme [Saprospiraceae bacterium]
MEFDRRKFIRNISALAGSLALPTMMSKDLQAAISPYQKLSSEDLAHEEDFWQLIKQAYTVSSTLLNLNNGGVSPQPKVVQQAVERYNQLSNEAPSYYMWRILDKGREEIRRKLADLAGCSPEEIAINRNTSEALETVIFGLRLKAGDEVVLTRQDYPNMINAYKQRAHREGIVLKFISFDFPTEDKEMIVQKFVSAFTAKTKIVHLTHMINWCGQILPVKEIAAEAHQRGIEVVIDGAHTFAHLDYNIPDLGADYFGTSLHKWLCAPFGSGMLYVKKEKIKNLYPMFAGEKPESDNIRKFESLGTRSFAIEQAIGQAVDFHQMIGSERKQKRLHALKNYWMEKVKDLPKVKLLTSLHPEFGGAIGMLAIEGKTPAELDRFLYRKHRIHTVSINWENIHGLRITPNVYTLKKDLDRLVRGVKEFVEG